MKNSYGTFIALIKKEQERKDIKSNLKILNNVIKENIIFIYIYL